MTIPTSTYRIQFRNGMTFDRAAAIVPYLARLGISHLYASPIFTATTGSTHGYDVTDANEIDPAIGGREGFDRLVTALKANDLGLILDIVPNHMAASLENAWWGDVIENGAKSRYSGHFDIDWSRRLTLPFLGDDFDKVLEAGDIAIRLAPKTGKPAFRYHDAYYPLTPASYARGEGDIETEDKKRIADLHDRQPYRLTSWRDAHRDLSYRRFFEVTGLAGVSVEQPDIFDDTHRLILELVRNGSVDGLRVDHVDGLADPEAYLQRLRNEAGPDCYITVEKILGEGEHLPADWPISGTTGYEFIAALSDVFVDDEKLGQLRAAYEETLGKPLDVPAQLRAAKLLMVDRNFLGEFNRLLALALNIIEAEGHGSQSGEHDLRVALRELVAAFPVYRTYGTPDGLPAESDEVLTKVITDIMAGPYAPDAEALKSLQHILRSQSGPLVAEFRTRFQQLTGPLMAKSIEDTLFYRQNMALALNEVGAEPLPRSYSPDRFHAEMAQRLERQPDALSTTSTHDTKRGEDARARLYAITEAPELWAQSVKRWQAMNAAHKMTLSDGVAPEPAVEWMLYQALAGVWPEDFDVSDQDALKSLRERFSAYVEKALREAKLRTNWGDGNEDYEKAVLAYADQLLSSVNGTFLMDFAQALKPFVEAGISNSLSQTLIKLTAPGVPDIYQGSEGFDLSLVDPDNRRLPDFDVLDARLAATDSAGKDVAAFSSLELKRHLIAIGLRMRRDMPDLFRRGRYLPLLVQGDGARHSVSYARVSSDDALIVIAPRLSMSADQHGASSVRGTVLLPPELAGQAYVDVLTGAEWDFDEAIDIAKVTGKLKLALLRKT